MDQEILNYCFANDSLALPDDCNCFVSFERQQKATIGRKLYHFAGRKPDLNSDDVFNKLFLSYFIKTPWFSADSLGNVFKVFNGIYQNQSHALLNLIRLLGKKHRAFFTTSNNFPELKRAFEISDDELLIDALKPDALMRALNAMRDHTCVCFFFMNNYPNIKNFLVSQKFVEGTDFVNAADYCSTLSNIPDYAQTLVRIL